jgi:hypothetical protein
MLKDSIKCKDISYADWMIITTPNGTGAKLRSWAREVLNIPATSPRLLLQEDQDWLAEHFPTLFGSYTSESEVKNCFSEFKKRFQKLYQSFMVDQTNHMNTPIVEVCRSGKTYSMADIHFGWLKYGCPFDSGIGDGDDNHEAHHAYQYMLDVIHHCDTLYLPALADLFVMVEHNPKSLTNNVLGITTLVMLLTSVFSEENLIRVDRISMISRTNHLYRRQFIKTHLDMFMGMIPFNLIHYLDGWIDTNSYQALCETLTRAIQSKDISSETWDKLNEEGSWFHRQDKLLDVSMRFRYTPWAREVLGIYNRNLKWIKQNLHVLYDDHGTKNIFGFPGNCKGDKGVWEQRRKETLRYQREQERDNQSMDGEDFDTYRQFVSLFTRFKHMFKRLYKDQNMYELPFVEEFNLSGGAQYSIKDIYLRWLKSSVPPYRRIDGFDFRTILKVVHSSTHQHYASPNLYSGMKPVQLDEDAPLYKKTSIVTSVGLIILLKNVFSTHNFTRVSRYERLIEYDGVFNLTERGRRLRNRRLLKAYEEIAT